jgi:glucose/arabinose dehydrogenase
MFLTAPAQDDRLFLLERAGLVRLFERNGVPFAAPFLDIRDRVGTAGEGGLLGLAFPSDYPSSGSFYVYYADLQGDMRVSRFQRSSSNANRAVASSERILLEITPPSSRHKGGTIAFSPIDGRLYVGVGDGGSRTNAQDPNLLLGKMLRLDVSGSAGYAIPADNPFRGNDGVRDEIWDFGLRNPFRFSFDRATGDLWIGDVGEDEREEVNFERAGDGGRNYGWPVHEGTSCYAPFGTLTCENPNDPERYTFPVHQYTHAVGCSITGGVVFRALGRFTGAYLFGDWCSNRFWQRAGGIVSEITGQIQPPAGLLDGVVAISEDGLGDVYFVSLQSGDVHRLR